LRRAGPARSRPSGVTRVDHRDRDKPRQPDHPSRQQSARHRHRAGRGDRYVAEFSDNAVAVIDVASRMPVASVRVGEGLGIAITPDGQSVYVADRRGFGTAGGGDVKVIDTATDAVVATIPAGSNPTEVAIGNPSAPCAGDCDGNGSVTVDELLLAVNVTLGYASLDSNGDGDVRVSDVCARSPIHWTAAPPVSRRRRYGVTMLNMGLKVSSSPRNSVSCAALPVTLPWPALISSSSVVVPSRMAL
jgi:YVTN family beta-propeller protein